MRPPAVATSASEMPAATTAKPPEPVAAMWSHARIMPTTVPTRPTHGAKLPILPSTQTYPRSPRTLCRSSPGHQQTRLRWPGRPPGPARRPVLRRIRRDRHARTVARRRVRPERWVRGRGIAVPDANVDAELDGDALQVAQREVQAHVIAPQVRTHLVVDDELDLGELPRRAEDRSPVVGKHVARVQVVELGEERPVRVDERFVRPRVRSPDLEGCAVDGDAA